MAECIQRSAKEVLRVSKGGKWENGRSLVVEQQGKGESEEKNRRNTKC